MFDYSTNVYQQGLIVLDSSLGAPELPPVPVSGGQTGWGYSTVALYGPTFPDLTGPWADFGGQIIRTTFTNVPVLWSSELVGGYQDLAEALSEITELDDEDTSRIDPPVYDAARYIASELMRMSFPAPRVFNHGPRSVVFNWSSGGNNLYLTISGDRMSALISSPDRIQRRIDYSASQLTDSSLAIFCLKAAYSESPVERLIPGTTPDPKELTA
jgi:hypothetical protein